jgi:hypothetical protein
MVRLPGGRLRWIIAGVLVVALVVAVIVAWPHARRYTGAAPPAQFYQKVQLEPALAPDYQRVLGVAHNLGTLAKALRYGADVIEIDVISARGRLVAGREQPLPSWPGWFSGGRRWPKPGTARPPRTSPSSTSSSRTESSSMSWSRSWRRAPGPGG